MSPVNTVTQEKVDAAIVELRGQGKLITTRRVRDILGDGSCTTILARIQSSSLIRDNNVNEKRYVLSGHKAECKLPEYIRWVADHNKPIFISLHKIIIAKLTLEEPVGMRIERVFLGNAVANWSDLLQHVTVKKSRWFFKMNYSGKEQSSTYIYLVPVLEAAHYNSFNDQWQGLRFPPPQSDQEDPQERAEEMIGVLHELKDQVLLDIAALNNKIGMAFAVADRLLAVPELDAAPLRYACNLAPFEAD
jgi:hypothetical protein